jgi:hypothetical protein
MVFKQQRSSVTKKRQTITFAVFLALASFVVASLLLIAAPDGVETQASRIAAFFQPKPFAPRNCDQARAMGLAPAYRGQPGYAPHLDADNDGIACEPFRETR